ncbi:MAG: hypothetical protein IPK60_16960 [Sandaracinaceae bacterium]|nr:hypothetical protein [Sandaracinaceae bacterium]
MKAPLKLGITGFGSDLPTVSFSEFCSVMQRLARAMRMEVVASEAAGVTPNFHQATLSGPDEQLVVVCNHVHPVIALARTPVSYWQLTFLDHPYLAETLTSLWPCEVLNVADLERPIEPSDLEDLSPYERLLAKDEHASRLGNLVFHWHD